MKHGQEIKCPHCGRVTFVIKKTLMDGWTNLGEVLACSLCNMKVADIEKSNSPDKGQKSAKSALSNLLGVEEEEQIEFQVSDEEKQFCRDCRHYIEHPFLTRCSLLDKKVSPMDDCPKWEKLNKE
jgi:hypothetical protein